MGKLFIIPTPIGNLKDMTFRAVTTLKSVDLILCEDTRVTSKLLKFYNISTPTQSYHQHNEHSKTKHFLSLLINKQNIALVSDAGTPGISDPGYLLVKESILNQIPIECLPGPTALIPALIKSGLPCDRFIFEGFLPVKKGKTKKLEEIAANKKTTIFYESPHRVLKTLQLMLTYFNEREIVVVKEISKMYETAYRGKIKSIIKEIENSTIKGEFVIITKGNEVA